MYRVSPSASASSRRGQILEAEWPPGGSNPHSDALVPRAYDADDEEFGGTPAKGARPESGGGDGICGGDREAGDGRDRISELPEAVLLCVLSYLPLRDAGRAAVLSSRWRGLFDQFLLDFNACQPFPPEEGRGCDWIIRAVTKILAARPQVPIRSFRFVMYGRGIAGCVGIIAHWFRSLARRGVREIDVDMFYTTPKPALPESLLQIASLETLKVYCCCFPDAWLGPAVVPRLPALRTLDLSGVHLSQHSLQAILSHCASLECVKLENITGVDKICLRSKSLTRLYADFGSSELKELVVEDAPELEELVGIGLPSGKAKLQIVSAPKLQVLGYLGISVRPIVLHDTVFDGGIKQLRTAMCSVKTLAIQVPFSEKGHTIFVAQLLRCFPNLEVLHVEPDQTSISRCVNVEVWDTENSIQCIERSVNRVVFENFGGEECQWEFLKFLLRMAKELKLVEFYCWKGKDWANEQIELMAPIHRASPGSEFRFFEICRPVCNLYLCHCCNRRCQKESYSVALI